MMLIDRLLQAKGYEVRFIVLLLAYEMVVLKQRLWRDGGKRNKRVFQDREQSDLRIEQRSS